MPPPTRPDGHLGWILCENVISETLYLHICMLKCVGEGLPSPYRLLRRAGKTGILDKYVTEL